MSVRSTIDNSIHRCALAEDGRSTGSSRKFTRNSESDFLTAALAFCSGRKGFQP